MPESIRESVKFKDGLEDIVLSAGDLEGSIRSRGGTSSRNVRHLSSAIAGGIWTDTVGGKSVLAFGVVWWSIATVLTPVAANIGLPFLLVVRAFMGIGEGVAMPAMNNILSKWVPVAKRSRSLALVYTGMYLGSVTGLAFSPFLIHKFGWPSVFFSFGSLGTVWYAVWLNKAHGAPLEDPELRPQEKKLIVTKCVSKEPVKTIPWSLILSKPPLWALIVSHFCHNWGTFVLLTWMPTYHHQRCIFFFPSPNNTTGGWIADTLASGGLSVTALHKIMQTIGFLGPAFFLSQLSHVDLPAMAVSLYGMRSGTDAFSQSGLYSNHQDIALDTLKYCLGYPRQQECWQGSLEQQQLVTSYNMVLGMMFSEFQLGSTWLERSSGTFSQLMRKYWIDSQLS
ncbi:hypothetical protein SLEP1_g55748 [Rubroshorea leprosula]|uniref:Major facilitator superfamily (MFS) profile domain-containing protein n=1 Tax=Rubroshorea leprosula TaxID=152421 RepID=A0AAV5MGG2_9ROSI|nr:hypothetical protein SLEP1_g55748 [Rubroshorea leprosula]